MERLFKTGQDRLVKERRLAGIATLEAANRFLEAWLPIYNQRFTVTPTRALPWRKRLLPEGRRHAAVAIT